MAENKNTPEPTDADAEKAAAAAAILETFGEFGEFSIETTRKPVGGVTEGQIPPMLAALLTEHAPKALADKDYELSLTAKDEATAKRLAGYARAWGARQEPKLYIHKLPNRRDMGKNIARLAVDLDSEVSEENRPGRKAK